jgi:hypothetical protein
VNRFALQRTVPFRCPETQAPRYAHFALQQDSDLNPAHWTTPAETVTDNGTTRFITVNLAPDNRFYRLFRP